MCHNRILWIYRCELEIVDHIVGHELHISLTVHHKHEPIKCLTYCSQTTPFLMSDNVQKQFLLVSAVKICRNISCQQSIKTTFLCTHDTALTKVAGNATALPDENTDSSHFVADITTPDNSTVKLIFNMPGQPRWIGTRFTRTNNHSLSTVSLVNLIHLPHLLWARVSSSFNSRYLKPLSVYL